MSSHTKIKTILFDWDGTLADTASLGLRAFQRAFAELDFPFPLNIYETNYSPNWYSVYEALSLPREKWPRADELWLKHYGEQTAQMIEGAVEVLHDLHRKGYQLGIVSSGSESRVCREVNQAKLANLFVTVICNEHIANKKPHPEGLHAAMNRLQASAAESAYVGDALEDIEMGKRAGTFTVAVRSDYPCGSKLLAAKPDIFLDSIKELNDHF